MDPVQKHNTIVSDGKGYYAYVTGVFHLSRFILLFQRNCRKGKTSRDDVDGLSVQVG